jgi:hypothetical protein
MNMNMNMNMTMNIKSIAAAMVLCTDLAASALRVAMLHLS